MTDEQPLVGHRGVISPLRRALVTIVAVGTLGALVVLPLGDRRQLSIDAWLIVVSVLLAIIISVGLLGAAPVRADDPVGLIRRRRREPVPLPRLPRELLSLEGVLLGARDSDRAFALRLKPRLTELARHYLSTDHGIDLDANPEQAADVLGPTAWLVDDSSGDRAPTLSDVEQLLDRLLDKRSAHDR